MTNGNITYTPNNETVTSFVNSVSTNLGIQPYMLFLFGFIFFMIPLYKIRASFGLYTFIFTAYSMFGLYLGIIPFWIAIVSIFLSAFQISKSLRGNYGSSYSESSSTWEYSKPSIVKEIKPEPKTINCKNCGGPNVNKVTCEWCGLVLE